jgi:Zn-finger nucleic acid-binding protein
MTTVDRNEVTLDECASCGALWFDRTELATTIKKDVPGARVQWGSTIKDYHGPTRLCPRDGAHMKAYEWDGIPFYRCGGCSGVLVSLDSWKVLHEAAEARTRGTGFAPVEIVRDLFKM